MSARERSATALGWSVLVAVAVLPVLVIAVQAVSSQWFFPELLPPEWTLSSVRRIVTDAANRSALGQTLLVSLAATLVTMVVAVPAARALALGGLRHRGLLLVAFLVPLALPSVAVAMGLNVALLRTGIAGGVVAVVVAHLIVTVPYAVILLTAALTRYDLGYERQAAVLGARPWRIIGRVFLPVAAPAIFATAAVTFVVSWGQYLLTLLPGGGRVITLPLLVLNAANGGNPAAATSVALAAAIPPAIAILIVVRRLDRLVGT